MEDVNAADDIITREVHLVVDKPVLLKMRSQDVIHSAFLPHLESSDELRSRYVNSIRIYTYTNNCGNEGTRRRRFHSFFYVIKYAVLPTTI